MTRFSTARYNVQLTIMMAAYIALLFWLWPHALHATSMAPRVLFALAPLVPVTWVIWLMARRVATSDELEQRLHLVALGVATALVGTASLVAAFLALAHVWQGDGSEFIYVFPALVTIYAATRIILKRRVTGSWDFCS